MEWTALVVTVKLAIATTLALFVLGIPIAYWLSSSTSRWKFIADALVALPLILPPTVVGFYLLIVTGPESTIGRAYEHLTGGTIPFSFVGILIGSIVYNLPFAVRPFAAAFAAVDRRFLEASWCLGESRARTFFRVTLPLSRAGILTGLVLTFAHTVGEFGVVLMMGGNLPGLTRTLSLAVYDDVQSLDYAAAHQTALVLLAFSFAVLCVTYLTEKERRSTP